MENPEKYVFDVCMYVCIFWGRYFLSLIIWFKNMVLISSRSLKSLYEDLWSPLIFKESKFLKIFIKILKRFLKVFGLFISVKKVNVFTISLKFFTKIFKNIFYFWRPFKISEDFEHLLNISNLRKRQEDMLKYTKKLLYYMFYLYFSGW